MSRRLALRVVRLSSHLGPRSGRVSAVSVRSAVAPPTSSPAARSLHINSRPCHYSSALSKCSQSSLAGRRRMFHCTATPRDDAKTAPPPAEAAAPAEEAAEEQPKGPTPFEKEVEAASTADDEVPEWQNPRHHNNPDKARVFEEEFGPDEEMPVAPLPPFDDGSDKVAASPELHGIAEEIINMSMIEVNELCNRVAEHFGIEEREGGPMMGAEDAEGGGGEAEDAAAAEERTAFDLKLVSFDAKAKIKVIKEVRSMAGLGLKEAKEVVEGAPKTVMKEIKMEEAEELKAKLEALGAVVEIV